ncbi:MAG: sensor histidine kinase [Bacillota bacterium]
MTGLFTVHRPLLFFGYGLSFFVMGLAVALQWRGVSRLRLAKNLWLLAAFGLLHGLAEWGYVFVPLQVGYLGTGPIFTLKVIHATLTAVSFAFLLAFGLQVVSAYLPPSLARWPKLPVLVRGLPVAAMLIWSFSFFAVRWLVFRNDVEAWFEAADLWARYLMALPGAVLTAAGFFSQAREFRDLGYRQVWRDFRGAAAVFAFYALVAGVIVPRAPFFPASVINQDGFFRLLGIPVQVFRAVCGLLVAISVIGGMEVFALETRRRLEEAEKKQAILMERIQIGRDLHDGLLQDLYGLSLHLELIGQMVEGDAAKAKTELAAILSTLRRITRSARAYILGLPPIGPTDPTALNRRLHELASELRLMGIAIELYLDPEVLRELPQEVACQLLPVAQEALSNVKQHAGATRVEVCLRRQEKGVLFAVRDDGHGFLLGKTDEGFHRGLANMRARAGQVGAKLEVRSAPGHGTEVRVVLDRDT